VTQVTTLVRKASGQTQTKLRELVHGDLLQRSGLDLACDVCIFAVGVSSAGLSEEADSKVYVFRPGFIPPLHGIRSRTPLYNVL
jgi:hypothetical protein